MDAPAPAAPAAACVRSWRRNPWWIPPFLGGVPDLEPALLRTLGLVTLGMFFEAYDLSLLTAALKQIGEGLGIPAGEFGFTLGVIRTGGLVAFAIVPLADRWGRRRVFLGSLVAMSLGTVATAFAQTPHQFLAIQVATRGFLASAAAVGVVMLTEEMPAAHRGWGIGMLGALAACGHGLGALVFAAVDVLPFGWRALYALGVIPLLFLPRIRGALPETARFREHARQQGDEQRGGLAASLRSLLALARSHPGRAAGVGFTGFVEAFGSISAFSFAAWYAQTAHAWAPWQYSTMVLTAGGVGIIGNIVAGRLGDRFGRRAVGFVTFAIYPLAAIGFYSGPGWALPACFALIVAMGSASDVVVRAFSTELFPTSQRGASAAWVTLLQTLGFILGPLVVGALSPQPEDLPRTIRAVATTLFAAGLFVWMLPETRGRELEALSQES